MSLQPNARVRFVPYQPLSLMLGGFEVQMLAALEAVRATGTLAAPLNPWSEEANYDIVHLWGLGSCHEQVVRWAESRGKSIVITALLPFVSPLSQLKYRVLGGEARSAKLNMLSKASSLVVVSEEQADVATKMLRVPTQKVRVIPNIVHSNFIRTGRETPISERPPGYVFCCGQVCRRKNQHRLVEACNKIGVSVVLAGDSTPGEEEYGEKVRILLSDNPRGEWITGLSPGSDPLVDLYDGCGGFALPSENETQPISVLEAMARGKPVLIGNGPYSRQQAFHRACKVDPHSVMEIARGLTDVLSIPQQYVTPSDAMEKFCEATVGIAYSNLYEEVLSSRQTSC